MLILVMIEVMMMSDDMMRMLEMIEVMVLSDGYCDD